MIGDPLLDPPRRPLMLPGRAYRWYAWSPYVWLPTGVVVILAWAQVTMP